MVSGVATNVEQLHSSLAVPLVIDMDIAARLGWNGLALALALWDGIESATARSVPVSEQELTHEGVIQ
ncbi:hypothetical protein BDZ97DRAFT_1914363 [Flammula alnicola]|nr:hypothetical protein BDZ97DRAFT_1914363 [Flammula alnicola]